MDFKLRLFKKYRDYSDLYEKIHSIDYGLRQSGTDCYWLQKPFAMACVKGESYEVIEPKLNAEEIAFLETVHRKLRERIILKDGRELENREVILFSEFAKEAEKAKLSDESTGKIWYYLRREFLGYGKIDALLRDSHIEDISCSGYGLPVYVYHRAYGSLRTNFLQRKRTRLLRDETCTEGKRSGFS